MRRAPLKQAGLSSQRGFTLMEVMVSTSATAVVIAAASAFLLKFLAWYDELSSRIAINRHARETYEVMSLGALSSTSGNDGTKNLYGLRARAAEPTTSFRTNYALRFRSNNLTLTPYLAVSGAAPVLLNAAPAGATGSVDWACASTLSVAATNRGLPAPPVLGTLNPRFAPAECKYAEKHVG